jgi:hypothetical protein
MRKNDQDCGAAIIRRARLGTIGLGKQVLDLAPATAPRPVREVELSGTKRNQVELSGIKWNCAVLEL